MRHVTPILLLIACAPIGLLATGANAGPELKKSDVKNVVMDAMPDIRRCGMDLKGETVTVKWVIEPEGNVTDVAVQGKRANDDIGRCLKRQVSQLRFGHSVKNTPVAFPFKLGTIKKDEKPPAASNGTLSKKDLDGLLEIVEGDLKKCGDGVANTRFTIKPSGQVRDVKVTDVDQKTEDCVTRKVSRLRFPPPTKPTEVRRSFTLSEGEG
jgi:hypothetical protein